MCVVILVFPQSPSNEVANTFPLYKNQHYKTKNWTRWAKLLILAGTPQPPPAGGPPRAAHLREGVREKNVCRSQKLRPTRLHNSNTNFKIQKREACVPRVEARVWGRGVGQHVAMARQGPWLGEAGLRMGSGKAEWIWGWGVTEQS